MKITPGQKVIFYLRGNIDKGVEFYHSCDGVANCKPTDFQIYGYGEIGTSPQICLNGNRRAEVFIFAPKYSVGVAGGGSEGGFVGSVWAENWAISSTCGSNTSHVVVTQAGKWEDLFQGITPKNVPPKISTITNWTRLERD